MYIIYKYQNNTILIKQLCIQHKQHLEINKRQHGNEIVLK